MKTPGVGDRLLLGPSIVEIHSRKSKCMTKNNNSQRMIANAATKMQNDGDLLIPVILTENVRSRESKRENTKNNDNK